jgi:serine/threonine-protein kinase
MAIAERIGQFKVVAPIARGGMGRVFLARQEETGQRIAIKVLPEEFLKDRKRSQYLDREVKIARNLKHQNVIDIYGLHQENGVGYLVMEYMNGGNLRQHMAARNLTLGNATNLILQICAGLHYIHNHKLDDGRFHSIIHRDIKPENILLSRQGTLKVADFGLSVSENFWGLRSVKSRAGTPLYMSPEQIRGKQLDVRTDIFSLGLVIYELLTGRLPYKTQDKKLYMKMVVSKKVEPAPPSYINAKIPREYDEITLKALQRRPGSRYQTVAEMMLDLRRLPPVLKKLSC